MDVGIYGMVAGTIVAVLQEVGQRVGWIQRYKRLIAVGASLGAGLVVAIVSGRDSTEDVFAVMGAALGTAQAIYALVITKLPAPPP